MHFTDNVLLLVQGVESERCASFSAALKNGRPVYTKAESTLADGLAVPLVGVNAFATAARLIDKVSLTRTTGIPSVLVEDIVVDMTVTCMGTLTDVGHWLLMPNTYLSTM